MSSDKVVPIPVKFFLGGAAGMAATCVVQPFDLIKTRMQVSGTKTGLLNLISSINRNEGFLAFYTGLSAGILRQATYSSARLGIYGSLYELASRDGQPNLLTKVLIGCTAGGIGAFLGTPAEVTLVRMTADGRLPIAERQNYKNVFDAIHRISCKEGVIGLWRGTVPTMGRAIVVNAAQLPAYYQSKEMLLNTGYFKDDMSLYFASSTISALVTAAVSIPVDIAKTRIQNMKIVDGKPELNGALDAIAQVCRNEGLFSLWKGFLPYFVRLGPHTVLTFLFLEKLTNLYKSCME